LRAIAVMHVKINYRYTLGSILGAGIKGGDGGVIEKAETHGAVVFGVVAGWAHGEEGVLRISFKHGIDSGGGSAHRAQNGGQSAGGHDGV
jgi:hypothetical protein